MALRVVRQNAWYRTKNNCAGEDSSNLPDLTWPARVFTCDCIYIYKDITFVTKTTNANYSYWTSYGCYGYLILKVTKVSIFWRSVTIHHFMILKLDGDSVTGAIVQLGQLRIAVLRSW
jgi:hypothetical protein